MLDLLLKNGTVVDGTGKNRFIADIGVSRGKISIMGDLKDAPAKKEIDVKGLTVCPGFIDMHSHSDLSILAHNKAMSSISQGITTEVVGSCGWSLAPCKKETIQGVLKGLIRGLLDNETFESQPWNWNSFGEYLDTVEATGIGVNIVPQVGQSLIRAHVVGTEKRAATNGEIKAMKALLEQSLEEGAWGMSTGRSYRPGGFASTEEIIELAKVLAKHDAIYATHMKNEGDTLFEAVDEVIRIARESGVKAEISHHKSIGKHNFGKINQTLNMIEDARRKGLRLTADLYPYEFSQVSAFIRFLPQDLWEHIEGNQETSPESRPTIPSLDRIKERLKDPEIAAKILSFPGLKELLNRAKNNIIVSSPSEPGLEGIILGQYAEEKGLDLASLLIRLITTDGFSVHAASPISLTDVHAVVMKPFVSVGTDAFTLDRQLAETPIHPRHYGTFPRVVGRFVKEDSLFSLEEAVRKCTGFPASVMGIPERGLIEIGYWADLVVFEENNFTDTATGKDPYCPSKGIEYVIINGEIALENGKHRPAFSGKILKRN